MDDKKKKTKQDTKEVVAKQYSLDDALIEIKKKNKTISGLKSFNTSLQNENKALVEKLKAQEEDIERLTDKAREQYLDAQSLTYENEELKKEIDKLKQRKCGFLHKLFHK